MYRLVGRQDGWSWLCAVGAYTLLTFISGCALRGTLPADVRERIGGHQRPMGPEWESLPLLGQPDRAAPLRRLEVPSSAEMRKMMGDSPPIQYRVITIADVVRTSSGSLVAELLELEKEAAWLTGQCDTRQCASSLLEQDVLRLRADEERQRNAARALGLFWDLAEAERVGYWLASSACVLDEALQDVNRLRSQGLVSGEQEVLLQIERRQLELQLSGAEQVIAQLNHQLGRAMRLALPPGGRFWPQANWQLKAELPDVEGCLERALATRPEMRLLARLREELTADTVAAVRRALAAQIASLGVAPGSAHVLRRWLECTCADAEAVVRGVQLDWLFEEFRQQVITEVRQKHQAVRMALVEAALAGEIRDLKEQHRNEMRVGRREGRVPIAQWVRAEVDWMKAELELARKIGHAKRMEVELYAACGDVASHVTGE